MLILHLLFERLSSTEYALSRVERVRDELAGDLDELRRSRSTIDDRAHRLRARCSTSFTKASCALPERLVRLRHVGRARDLGEGLLEQPRHHARRGTRRRPGARPRS